MVTTLDAFYPMTGVTEQLAQWQTFSPYYYADGVTSSTPAQFSVIQHTAPNMSVDVGSGQCFIQGVFGVSGSTKNMTVAAADATNPRIDRVVLRLDTVAQNIGLVVVTGTPAVSPSAPALVRSATQTDYSLAQVRVNTTVTSIVTANITDERQYSSPRGIPLAQSVTAASTIEPYGPSPLTDGMQRTLVSGTTSITNIAVSNAPPNAGSVLVLEFLNPGCTVVRGGNVPIPRNYVSGTVDSLLTLWWDGTEWLEIARAGEQVPAHQYYGNNTGTAANATFASIVAGDLPTYGTITMGALTQGTSVAYTQNSGRAAQLGKTWHAYGQLTATGTGTAGTSVILALPSGTTFNGGSGVQVGQWRVDGASSWAGNLTGTGATTMQFEMLTNPMTFFGTSPTHALVNTDVIFFNIVAEIL